MLLQKKDDADDKAKPGEGKYAKDEPQLMIFGHASYWCVAVL